MLCLGVAFYDFSVGRGAIPSLGTEYERSRGKEEEREVLILKMFLAQNVLCKYPELSKANVHL